MCKYVLLFLMCFLVLFTTIILSNDLFADTIDGLITDVNSENNGIIIDGKTYTLIKGCTILRNDKYSELAAIRPISKGFYHWAELSIDSSGFVTDIRAYYQIVEGIIEEISFSDNYIRLALYNEKNDSKNEHDIFYLNSKQREEMFSLMEGEHIVLIVAREEVLEIVDPSSIN